MITVKEAAKDLNLHPATLWNWINYEEGFPVSLYHFGNAHGVEPDQIRAWMRDRDERRKSGRLRGSSARRRMARALQDQYLRDHGPDVLPALGLDITPDQLVARDAAAVAVFLNTDPDVIDDDAVWCACQVMRTMIGGNL